MSTLLHSRAKGLHEEQYLVDHSTLNEKIQNQENGNHEQTVSEGGKEVL